jgi:sulfur-carrier protein adenylyltransferase/sulfurtransferase
MSEKQAYVDVASIDLSKIEMERYSRHLLIPEISISGQRRIKGAKVLCVGVGGLGSPVIMYLAAAGIGRLGLIDCDVVDISNLQRQVIHSTKGVGQSKLKSAKEFIENINPHVQVDLFDVSLSAENALDIFEPYDIVIDGTDNFPTRYLVNDACVLLGKPNIYGSILKFEGQVSVFWAKKGPCYRCLYPEPPPPGLIPNCAEGGVLGVLPGIVGTLQATEAIKLIVGVGETLIGRLQLFDALTVELREVEVRKDPNCPLCGVNKKITQLIDYDKFCGNQTDVHVATDFNLSVTVEQLNKRLIIGDGTFILDVREPNEFQISHIAGSTLIPLGELPSRLDELKGKFDIVVCCKTGIRSAKAAELLRHAGFGNVTSLAGGILEWAKVVDTTMPKY